jgi:DNA-binding transcriptional MerR regulator
MSIMESAERGEWTLCEAARLLGEPQHRLIYLCEKGVIQPDLQDAEGRGSSRRFSERNLLEFGIALRLRALGIPACVCGAFVYVLRGFEKELNKEVPGFSLPGSLVRANAPELKAVIGDDRRLYFSLSTGRSAAKTYGGVPLADLVESASKGGMGQTNRKRLRGAGNEVKEGVMRARVEVSVTGIAQDLGLKV